VFARWESFRRRSPANLHLALELDPDEALHITGAMVKEWLALPAGRRHDPAPLVTASG